MQVYRTANGYLGKAALAAGRTPPSHPEGYLEPKNVNGVHGSHGKTRKTER